MKAIFFIVGILVTSHTLAQIDKGNFLIGGSIGISNTEFSFPNSNLEKQETFSIFFNPNVSYFLTSGLAVGLVLPWSYSSTTPSDMKSSSISIGPEVRYYFPFENWAIFTELSYNIGFTKFEGQFFDPEIARVTNATISGDVKNFNAGLGLTFFLKEAVGIEGIFGYTKTKNEYDKMLRDTDNSSINFNIGLQFYLVR